MDATTVSKNKNLPKLRFPGFFGVWEEKKLGELSDLITKGTTPKEFVKSGVRFIKIECFNGNNIDASKCLFVNEMTHNKELKRSILRENDILFAIAGATIGKVNIVSKEILTANTNQALSIIRLKETVNRDFVYCNLKSDRMKKYILDSISVGAQPNLNLEQMNNFSFFSPSELEQQKIASFLGSVDLWIENLRAQKENLEAYKKGMMQKIFSQEVRFKDNKGKGFPEWKEKKFEDIFDTVGTKKYQIKSSEFLTSGEYKVVDQGKNLIAGYSNNSDKLYKNFPVIIFGDHTTVLKYIDFDFVIGADGTKILKSKNNGNLKFLFYLLECDPVKPEGYKRHFNILKNRLLSMPSLLEQQKIADFLISIDNIIELKQQQITQAEFWKKGLMQGLLV